MDKRTLHPVNVTIGKRLNLRRRLLGMSRARLAKAVKMSPNLIHIYEDGRGDISMPRLRRLAKTLGVPVVYFFDGLQQ